MDFPRGCQFPETVIGIQSLWDKRKQGMLQ